MTLVDVQQTGGRTVGNLDVDHARAVVVIKRSMGHGYAGIDNELYTNPKTGMLFADAKQGIAQLVAAVRTFAR